MPASRNSRTQRAAGVPDCAARPGVPAPVLAERGEVVSLSRQERHAPGREDHALPRDAGEGNLAHPSKALLVVCGEFRLPGIYFVY